MNKNKYGSYLLLLLLMAFSNEGFANNAKMTLSFHREDNDSCQAVATSDGTWHAWENSRAEYAVLLEDSIILNDTIVFWKDAILNDTVVFQLFSEDGTLKSSDTTRIGQSIKTKMLLEKGKYKIQAELSVLFKDSTYRKETLDGAFQLWEKPNAEMVNWEKADSVIWDNTPNNLTIGVTEGEWRYSWYDGEKLVSNDSQGPKFWTLVTNASYDPKTVTLEVECIAPDGETIWLSDTLSKSLVVWRYPTITLKETEPEMYYRHEKMLNASTTGGDTQWVVWWSDGNKDVSDSLSCLPQATPSNKSQKKTYIFHAYDKPQGMSEALAYTAELPCTVTFWPEPKVKVDGNTTFSLFSGDNITLKLLTEGHDNDEWSFIWKQGSNVLGTGPTYTFSGKNNQNDGSAVNSEINVQATLKKTALGDLSFDDTFTYYITVWPKPQLTQQIVFNERTYKSSEIDVCAKDAGKNLSLQALTSGGDKKAWSYTWTHNSTPVLFFDPLLVFAIPENSNREDQITHLFKVEATNKPENIVSPKMLNANFTVRVWPRPVLDFPADTNLTVVAGDIISISQMAHGGYAQGWKYICSVNNRPSQPLTEYEFENDTDEIKEVSLKGRVVNDAPNDQWFSDDVIVNAKVYPKPIVEVKGLESDTAYYYGDSFAIKASHHSYRYGTWHYKLTCNGKTIQESSDRIDYFDVIPSSSNENETYQYALSVSCITEDGITLFSKTYSSTINAYMKYACAMDQTNPVAAYDGEHYSLKVAPLGGKSVYWTYQWYDEQDRPLSAIGSLFSKTVELKNSLPREVKYHVVCTYKPFKAQAISETLTWTVIEYAAIVEGQKEVEPLDMVRQDDSVVLSIISPQYGNPNGWHYQWYVGQEEMGDEYVSDESVQKQRVVFEQPISYGDKEKLISTVTYRLKCWNMSPDGKTRWGQEQNIDYTFTVHRRPEQPTLVRKGGSSNTSGIYVVKNFGLTDNELEELEYTIEFGDQVGVLQTDTTLRYFRYTGSPKDVWARSRWDYSDGFLCYSDKAFLNNEQKEEASGILHVEGNRFFIELDEPAAAVVTLYEYDGTIARTYSYPEQMSFDEELDLSGLKKGVCVMRFSIGDIVESYKTIVK